MLLFGFASGLPLFLTNFTLQQWLSESHVSLRAIGATALIGLPYTLKFLWAPIADRIVPPFGRRRGWLLIIQPLLAAAIFLLGPRRPPALARRPRRDRSRGRLPLRQPGHPDRRLAHRDLRPRTPGRGAGALRVGLPDRHPHRPIRRHRPGRPLRLARRLRRHGGPRPCRPAADLPRPRTRRVHPSRHARMARRPARTAPGLPRPPPRRPDPGPRPCVQPRHRLRRHARGTFLPPSRLRPWRHRSGQFHPEPRRQRARRRRRRPPRPQAGGGQGAPVRCRRCRCSPCCSIWSSPPPAPTARC